MAVKSIEEKSVDDIQLELAQSLTELRDKCLQPSNGDMHHLDEIIKAVRNVMKNYPTSEERENIQLDSIAKSLFKLSPGCILGAINECFDSNYGSKKMEIKYLDNNLINADNNFEKTETDIVMEINKEIHHLEIQTLNDQNMQYRLFNYAIAIGQLKKEYKNLFKNIHMPIQAIVYLEKNNNIVDQQIKLMAKNMKDWDYYIKTIRLWNYTIDDLLAKKMYCLLPLIILRYRKECASIVNTKSQAKKKKIPDELAKKSEELKATIQRLTDEIEKLFKSKLITEDDMHIMLLAIGNLTEYLNKKFFKNIKLKEEVHVMITTLYDPALVERGRAEGKIEGKKEGEIKGEIKVLYTRLNMSAREISKDLKIPLEKVEHIIKNELNL